MKFGLIGAGHWGKNLLSNLYEMNLLHSVAEYNLTLRESLQNKYTEIKFYEDYKQIIEADLQAVVIATPAHTHFSLAKEALEAKKHVFVEKLFTLSVHEACELVDLAHEKNKILMVGHLLLYQPAIMWIKNFLAEGKLGNVYSLHQERLNHGKVRSVENVLWSLGVHDIAVINHLVPASLESIVVVGQAALQKKIEDDIYLHLLFNDNTQDSFSRK